MHSLDTTSIHCPTAPADPLDHLIDQARETLEQMDPTLTLAEAKAALVRALIARREKERPPA